MSEYDAATAERVRQAFRSAGIGDGRDRTPKRPETAARRARTALLIFMDVAGGDLGGSDLVAIDDALAVLHVWEGDS